MFIAGACEPILACDSHHGVYSFQLLFAELCKNDVYKTQAYSQLSAEDIQSLIAGPDDEFYWDAADALCDVEFITPQGVSFSIVSNEDLWYVPNDWVAENGDSWFI